MKPILRVASIALATAIMVIAARQSWQIIGRLSASDVTAAVRATPATMLALSTVLTVLSFAGLAYYEQVAVNFVAPGRIRAGMSRFVGLVSHAIANTLGFAAVTGSALRLRLYRQQGLGAIVIARIVVIVGACTLLGSASALCLSAGLSSGRWPWLAAAAAAISFAAIGGSVWLRRWRDLPWNPGDRGVWLRVLGVGMIEAISAIGALYVLLPEDTRLVLPVFVALVSAAMFLGLLSHAPGGIGVFETAVLSAFPGSQHPQVLGALLLYRLIYNLLPFVIAVAALGVWELRTRSDFNWTVDNEP